MSKTNCLDKDFKFVEDTTFISGRWLKTSHFMVGSGEKYTLNKEKFFMLLNSFNAFLTRETTENQTGRFTHYIRTWKIKSTTGKRKESA